MYPARPRRALIRAQAVARPKDSPESQQLLLPLVVAFLCALMLAWPTQVRAQGGGAVTASSEGTHTVRTGETLWALAARYYGDGRRWSELASLNGLGSGGERAIAVGQLLRVPTERPPLGQARAAMAEAPPSEAPRSAVTPAVERERLAEPEPSPAPVSAAEPVAAPASAPASAPAPAPASAPTSAPAPEPAPAPATAPTPALSPVPVAELPPAAPLAVMTEPERASLLGENPDDRRDGLRVGLVEARDLALARGNDNTTIFLGPAPFDRDTMGGTIDLNSTETFVQPAGRRSYEFEAAPFALDQQGWQSAGTLGRRAGVGGSAGAVSMQRLGQRMQQWDFAEIRLPSDMEPVVGEHYVTVKQGTDLRNGLRLAVPTGVLRISEARGEVVMAQVLRLYDIIDQGQAIVPLVEAPAVDRAEQVDTAFTTVRWITEGPLLPSLESYLILATHDVPDIAVGDRFALLSDEAASNQVAEVRVVRVSGGGATAIVMHHSQPSIRVGMRAVRIGHAP